MSCTSSNKLIPYKPAPDTDIHKEVQGTWHLATTSWSDTLSVWRPELRFPLSSKHIKIATFIRITTSVNHIYCDYRFTGPVIWIWSGYAQYTYRGKKQINGSSESNYRGNLLGFKRCSSSRCSVPWKLELRQILLLLTIKLIHSVWLLRYSWLDLFLIVKTCRLLTYLKINHRY